jgi:hypothetical protein
MITVLLPTMNENMHAEHCAGGDVVVPVLIGCLLVSPVHHWSGSAQGICLYMVNALGVPLMKKLETVGSLDASSIGCCGDAEGGIYVLDEMSLETGTGICCCVVSDAIVCTGVGTAVIPTVPPHVAHPTDVPVDCD